jgi:hypothetical protein
MSNRAFSLLKWNSLSSAPNPLDKREGKLANIDVDYRGLSRRARGVRLHQHVLLVSGDGAHEIAAQLDGLKRARKQ